MKVLVTGSMGLVGSEAARFYLDRNCFVTGVDNDMRRHFFGEEASVAKNMIIHPNYLHVGKDISKIEEVFKDGYDVIIHAAAQPSHDWAAQNPLLDFGINAYGTLMLLEMTRKYSPDSVFIYVSTNKVYGDWPNHLDIEEQETRYERPLSQGIDETMPIDQCTHSLFGVSKLSGDLMAQEYARYFGIKTGIFRCGCITGPQHAGTEQHGFLSYIVKCYKNRKKYTIYGYKGKQVRDNIHAHDLVRAFDHFVNSPRPGEVYNMGGGRHSNISVLEALNRLDMEYEYILEPRKGDHIWYITDTSKFKSHYPEWEYEYDIDRILDELIK